MSARNSQTLIRLAALLGLGLLLVACATRPDIRTQAAVNANLTSYHTYAFMPKPGTDKDGYKTLTTQSLERAVNREMLVRGYAPAGGRQPDLLINFNVKTKNKVEGDVGSGIGYGWGYGYGYGWGGPYGYGVGLGLGDYYNGIQTVTEGSLMIDLIDRARNEVVWSGTAVGELTKQVLDNPDQTIDRSVAEIFARYPLKAR
ncbi:MAG: DUF4136 domain-containing protein [Steroidobacteraceae bacterium]